MKARGREISQSLGGESKGEFEEQRDEETEEWQNGGTDD